MKGKVYKLFQTLGVLFLCCMLNYCASKPKVPSDGNTKKRNDKNEIIEQTGDASNQKTMTLEKTETTNSDHVEVSFSLKNVDTSKTYTIFSKWNKEALLEADADIATLDWEGAEQGPSGMKLKLPRDSEEAYKAYIYVKVQDKEEAMLIKESFVIDVPALEEETDDQEENAPNALAVLEGDKILCAGQRNDVAIVLSYDSKNEEEIVNLSRDNLKTWSVLATLDADLEDIVNCHIGMHENHALIVSDAMLNAGNDLSNQFIILNFNSGTLAEDFLPDEEFSLIADQFSIKDVEVKGDRAYIALSNTEQNKLILLYIQPTANTMFDGDKTRVATLSGISPIESILPEQENIDDFYDFTFLTQDKRSYLGKKQTGIDWTVSDNDLVCLMESGVGDYYVEYQQANKKILYYTYIIIFDAETYEETIKWIPRESELTVPLAAETINNGANNQLILHNKTQIFFVHQDEQGKETGRLLGLKPPQSS